MCGIGITSDAPGFFETFKISIELYPFSKVLSEKFPSIDCEFLFVFRVLELYIGRKSFVRYYPDKHLLLFDLTMPTEDFWPYKGNKIIQRRIIGKYFFDFFCKKIGNYKYKIPSLKDTYPAIIECLREFLVEHLWLPDSQGKYNFSLIEKISYEEAMNVYGPPKSRKFQDLEDNCKLQNLTWILDKEGSYLNAEYKLYDRRWNLMSYSIVEAEDEGK